MKIWCYSILLYLLFLSSLKAENNYVFKHFNLKGVLENRIELLKKIKHATSSEQIKLKEVLFGQDSTLWGDSVNLYETNSRLDENTLIEIILKEVAQKYQEIGSNRSGALIEYNKKFDLGSQNHSGFNRSKPSGEYGFSFDRKIEPEIGNWMVKDSLMFYVEASTFIKKLKENGAIEASDETINALAGVRFKRTYQYHHLERSYLEGLTSDFSKLFLNFLKFRKDQFLKLNPNDLITKDDQFLIKVSGMAKIPLTTGIDLNSTFGYTQKVLAQSLIKCLENQSINIAGERGVQMEGSIDLDILGEFYNLIKIVFLAFEFDFNLKEQQRWHFYLPEDQLATIKNNPELLSELHHWVNFQSKNSDPEKSILKPFINMYEKRKEFNYNYDVKSIIWRTLEHHQDQFLEFISKSENIVSYFLKSINENINYIENIWASLFPEAITSLINTFFGYLPPVEYINSTKSKVEFALNPSAEQNEINTNKVRVSLTNELFFEVERKMEIYTARKSYYKKFTAFLNNYTDLNNDNILESYVNNKTLSVPLIINSIIRVNNNGFHYFDQLTDQQITNTINEVCSQYNFFKRKNCENEFNNTFEDYKNQRATTSEIKLQLLNHLVDLINKYAKSIAHYGLFFGEKNLFVTGSFKALTVDKIPFTSYFGNSGDKIVGPVKELIEERFPYLNSLYEFDEAF
ncbi:MAG: hypothetical protein U0T83_07040 [Bacteriovoracaceae bacterium]